MSVISSQNALPVPGALYVTISFQTIEVGNKTFFSDGNTHFCKNVKANKNLLKNQAIYNAVKREFPNRTVTPYNIQILEYHYQYFLNNYEEYRDKKNGKIYQKFTDFDTHKTKKYRVDLHTIKDKSIIEFKPKFGNDEDK
jgi:hypothetical protein